MQVQVERPEKYRVKELRRQVVKFLDGASPGLKKRLEAKTSELTTTPYPSGCRKLRGAPNAYRPRVGGHRLLYAVIERDEVPVVTIRPREPVYERPLEVSRRSSRSSPSDCRLGTNLFHRPSRYFCGVLRCAWRKPAVVGPGAALPSGGLYAPSGDTPPLIAWLRPQLPCYRRSRPRRGHNTSSRLPSGRSRPPLRRTGGGWTWWRTSSKPARRRRRRTPS